MILKQLPRKDEKYRNIIQFLLIELKDEEILDLKAYDLYFNRHLLDKLTRRMVKYLDL